MNAEITSLCRDHVNMSLHQCLVRRSPASSSSPCTCVGKGHICHAEMRWTNTQRCSPIMIISCVASSDGVVCGVNADGEAHGRGSSYQPGTSVETRLRAPQKPIADFVVPFLLQPELARVIVVAAGRGIVPRRPCNTSPHGVVSTCWTRNLRLIAKSIPYIDVRVFMYPQRVSRIHRQQW